MVGNCARHDKEISTEDVWQKVREELGELEVEVARKDQVRMEEEFGDFMFAMINAARLYGINPEDALEKSTEPWFVEHIYSKLIKKMGI